jgi:hypothetical protein
MALRLLAGALAALCVTQAALAQVSYTYTGAKFNQVNVLTFLDAELPPEWALEQSAAAKAILLNDQIGVTLVSPVYLPTGWTTIAPFGLYGELATKLSTLPPLGIDASVSWALTNSAYSAGGVTLWDNFSHFDPSVDSRFTASLHVGAGNVIDSWEITLLPSDAYEPPTWQIAIGSSSADGDTLLYEFGANHYYQRREAAVGTAGSWAVSGTPLAVVPEPGAASMLLGGLALIGAALRKRPA